MRDFQISFSLDAKAGDHRLGLRRKWRCSRAVSSWCLAVGASRLVPLQCKLCHMDSVVLGSERRSRWCGVYRLAAEAICSQMGDSFSHLAIRDLCVLYFGGCFRAVFSLVTRQAPRLNFVVQPLLGLKEALIRCFVAMSFSWSVVEVFGD